MTIRDELAAHNERVKLRSNTANAIALGFIGFGFLRPLVDEPAALQWFAMVWAVVGLAIHRLASYILHDMRRRRDENDV